MFYSLENINDIFLWLRQFIKSVDSSFSVPRCMFLFDQMKFRIFRFLLENKKVVKQEKKICYRRFFQSSSSVHSKKVVVDHRACSERRWTKLEASVEVAVVVVEWRAPERPQKPGRLCAVFFLYTDVWEQVEEAL